MMEYSAHIGHRWVAWWCLAALWGMFKCPQSEPVTSQKKQVVLRSPLLAVFTALTFIGRAPADRYSWPLRYFCWWKSSIFSIQEIVALFFCNNLINFMVAPLVGKAINRFGERKVLSVEYSMLIIIFLVYAVRRFKSWWWPGLMSRIIYFSAVP